MTKYFYYIWISQMLSQVTVNVMNFLLLSRIFDKTGSTIATSLLWVTYSLPSIFFGPIGAGVVDLVNRKKTLVITNMLQALVVFLYALSYEYSDYLLFAVVLGYSFLNQFYVPAESATLPSVVSKEKLTKANSLFFLTQQLTLVIGFGFAGLLEKIIGFNGALYLCSLSLFIAFISVLFLPNSKPIKKIPSNFEDLMTIFFKHIIEGYRFIKSRKTILYPLGLLFAIQLGLSIVFTNLPVMAKEILKVSQSYVGLLVVVPAGIGATMAALVINKLILKGFRKKTIIDLGLLTLGFGTLAVCWLLPFIPPLVRFISGPLLVILIGFGFVAINIPTLTYLQEKIPVWFRGRVFGNLYFMITLSTIFPIIFSGVITEFFGVKALLSLLSFGTLMMFYYSVQHGQKLIQENF